MRDVREEAVRTHAPEVAEAIPEPALDEAPEALPWLADHVVPRLRVTEALLERLDRHGIVHVIASAGAGKTTAVAQALQGLECPIVWVTLASWHRAPGRLLDALVGALEPRCPGLGAEVARARGGGAPPAELAALVGGLVGRRSVVLVFDDSHVVWDADEAMAVLAALVGRRSSSLRVVLVGRMALPLSGLGVDALDPKATVGDDLLRATPDEAEDILREHASTAAVADALDATGGWIAGLVFEAWRSTGAGPATGDPLGAYLDRELRPRLRHDGWALLVASSLFDEVDVERAGALGAGDPEGWLLELRAAGLPAAWATGGRRVRLHSRVRELLRAELDAWPTDRRRSALRAAAAALEREADLERAIELYTEADDVPAVQRLLPLVIVALIERHDLAVADRYLAWARLDPEPASIVLGRLMLASIHARTRAGHAVLDPLLAAGRLGPLMEQEPRIGALACHFLAARGRLGDALATLDAIPPGRSADVARLALSLARDDAEAPIPPFAGDVLDAVLARILYSRGRLQELRSGRTAWAASTGAHELGSVEAGPSAPTSPPALMRLLTQFAQAIERRDLDTATARVAELERIGATTWSLLADAELAIRLARDPSRAQAAIGRLHAAGVTAIPFFRELAATWAGAASLLSDDTDAAAALLQETVASMRRGDRTLELPSALVYLAEAEWRCGRDEAADRAADDAYACAHRQGTLRGLLLALADFPGVLSRRLDVEPGGESVWSSLGRALVVPDSGAGRGAIAPVAAHLREFGEVCLVVGGHVVRPKIRKSLELLSYLLERAAPRASRTDVLEALWNGRDDESSRAYLRQALRHLRDVLPDGVAVLAEGDHLWLAGAVTSESVELSALVAEAARDPGPRRLGVLLAALELTDRGAFLAGSNDVRWVDDRRSRIASIVADVRLDAAELLLDADRHLEALALVEDALDADPLRERAWRLKMQALGLLGDADGVIAAFGACRAALAEIGLEPSRPTVELARTLRR